MVFIILSLLQQFVIGPLLKQGVAVYVPPAQAILKTVPPTGLEWVVVLLAALLPALIIELWRMRENGTPSLVNFCRTH